MEAHISSDMIIGIRYLKLNRVNNFGNTIYCMKEGEEGKKAKKTYPSHSLAKKKYILYVTEKTHNKMVQSEFKSWNRNMFPRFFYSKKKNAPCNTNVNFYNVLIRVRQFHRITFLGEISEISPRGTTINFFLCLTIG